MGAEETFISLFIAVNTSKEMILKRISAAMFRSFCFLILIRDTISATIMNRRNLSMEPKNVRGASGTSFIARLRMFYSDLLNIELFNSTK